jgi:hypothetical protein
MIHVYGLAYWILPYSQKTIDSILATASEKIHITVIEGRSKHSGAFMDWGQDCLTNGKIQRFVAADDNCRGLGLNWAFNNHPPDASEDFCVFTDLDLLIPSGVDWIQETRQAMKVGSCSGFSLDEKNYLPPNSGHSSIGFGNWLMACKTHPFSQYPKDLAFQDVFVTQHMRKFGPTCQIKTQLYHLGWDAPRDDPDYWQYKISAEGQDYQRATRLNVGYKVCEPVGIRWPCTYRELITPS